MFVNATDVKNNFGYYLSILDQEDVIILRNGRPVARLTRHTEWQEGLPLSEEPAEYCVRGEGDGRPDEYDGQSMVFSRFIKMYEKSDKRYEYIDGRVWLMGAPTEEHQRVLGNLHILFHNHLLGKPCRAYLAPLDVHLGSRTTDRNVVQPDLLVVCDMSRFNDKGRYIGAPSLVVEVMSLSNRIHDLIRKMSLYLRSGVREYWTIDLSNRQICIYSFLDDQSQVQNSFVIDSEVQSLLMRDLKFRAADIFS